MDGFARNSIAEMLVEKFNAVTGNGFYNHDE